MPGPEPEDKRRNDVIAVAAHELRNPVAGILGALDLLKDSKVLGEELPPKAKGIVDMMFTTSKRMLRLINDYLDLEKMESSQSAPFRGIPVEAAAVARQVLDMHRPLASQRGIELVLEESERGLRLSASADRLAQVITNLVSNAVKFTRDKSSVCARVSRHDGKIRVAVSDQGFGIPEDFRGRIFQKFAQSDAQTGPKTGSGLGLAISKAIVEKMGGSIGYDTKLGQGTTFFFDLPAA